MLAHQYYSLIRRCFIYKVGHWIWTPCWRSIQAESSWYIDVYW